VYLQVALDLTDLDKALRVADEVIKGGADIVEVGTPLIKKYGILPIKLIKSNYPDVKVLADTKTIDAGVTEANVVFKAGADMMTVLGLADDATLMNALNVARDFGREIVVDLINVTRVVERTLELYNSGLTSFCFHIGVDVQKARNVNVLTLLREVKKVKESTSIKAFVAGGIKLKDVHYITKASVDVIVVGSAIVRSPDPLDMIKKFKEALKGV